MRRGPRSRDRYLAARELGVRVLLVGLPAEVKRELARHTRRGLSIEVVPASEVIAMSDSPAQAFRRKKDSSAHVAARLGAHRSGRRAGERRKHRRGDDRGALCARHAAFGAKAGAGGAVSDQPRRRGRSDRRRRERGFQGEPPVAVRRDGRDLLPGDLRHAAAQGGSALHRRGRDQGQRAHQGSVQPAQGPAAQFRRQRRRARRLFRQRGRDRLRRLHRQCGPEDQRGRGPAYCRGA